MQVALLWNVDKNKDGKEKETGKSRGRGRDKGEITCYGKILLNIAKNNLFIIKHIQNRSVVQYLSLLLLFHLLFTLQSF